MPTNERSILILYTGGTIGMVRDPETGSLHPVDLNELYDHVPLLSKFNCRLEFIAFDPLLDSSDMMPAHWIQMAGIIGRHYEEFDGFVVLHGSDTMAYTASALSFMLENLNKPVILTGSQLPLGMIRSDGRENFVTAVEIAAAYEDDTAIVPEVAIYFENMLLRGNRTSKYNAENFEAFSSGNYPPLAEAGVHIKYHRRNILRPNFRKLKVHTHLENRLALLKIFPGIPREVVEALLGVRDLQGVVLESYGMGNSMSENWFVESIRETTGKGIPVYNVTQCLAGSVELGRYPSSQRLQEAGVISGYDITTESALAKMMYLLGSGYIGEELQGLLVRSLRGEMTAER